MTDSTVRQLLRTPILALALLVVATAPGRAAAGSPITAQVSRTQVQVDERFTLTVTLAHGAGDDVEDLRLPDVNDFASHGSSTSEQMRFAIGTQGQTFSKVKTYTFVLSAPVPGTHTIGPGSVTIEGRRYTTRPMTITVTGSARSGPATPTPPAAPTTAPPSGDETDIFLRVNPAPEEVYLGQQVAVNIDLYSRTGISSVKALRPPSLEGFWVEEFDEDASPSGRLVSVDGRPYRLYTLKSYALFPLKSGEVTIPPFSVELTSGQSFLFAGRTIKRASRPVPITVRPLPATGQPDDFASTNVGRYAVRAEIDTTTTRVGEPVTYRVTVNGTGNIRNVTIPELPQIPDFRGFAPTIKDTVEQRQGLVVGQKTTEYLLIPTTPGNLRIPSIRFSYFDPQSKEYRTIATPGFTVQVDPAPAGAGTPPPPASAPQPPVAKSPPPPASVPASGAASRPLHLGAAPTALRSLPTTGATFWALLLAPPLLYLLLLVSGRRRRERPVNPAGQRRKARTATLAQLKAAREAARAGDSAACLAALDEALHLGAAAWLDVATRGLSRAELRTACAADATTASALEPLLAEQEWLESVRFAPEKPSREHLQAAVERAQRVIQRLEGTR